jgi:hypothetical protein
MTSTRHHPSWCIRGSGCNTLGSFPPGIFRFDWEYVSGASKRAADALWRQDVDPIHSTWGSLNLHNDPSKPHNFIHKGSINAMVIVNSDPIDQLRICRRSGFCCSVRKSYGILSLRRGTPIQGLRSMCS